jgi:hypothetical protein
MSASGWPPPNWRVTKPFGIVVSNTSERSVQMDVMQRYPMPFKSEVIEASNSIGLSPAYVYGLIRQESRFILDARSSVGASGLMQIMPATAKWTAKKMGLKNFAQNNSNKDKPILLWAPNTSNLFWTIFKAQCPWQPPLITQGPADHAAGVTVL